MTDTLQTPAPTATTDELAQLRARIAELEAQNQQLKRRLRLIAAEGVAQ